MTQSCPACGREAEGRFCAHCGAGLDADVTCAECGALLPRGGRFCNQCGAATAATRVALVDNAAARPNSNLPWLIAGAAVVVLIMVLLIPRLRSEDNPAVAPTGTVAAPFAANGAAPVGDPGAIDLSSMTPRQAADRLFNRVMRSVAAQDSAQAMMFLPMALASYQRVADLDADGHYHMAVLDMVNSDPQSARAEADTILKTDPNHLFGLFSAAQAEEALGNPDSARSFYQRFLENYDSESARALPGYQDHAPLLPTMRETAAAAVK